MLQLTVKTQEDYVTLRHQDYRMVLELELYYGDTPSSSSASSLEEGEYLYQLVPELFLVYTEPTGGQHFMGIAEPAQLDELGTTPAAGDTHRSRTVDLFWPSKILAEQGLDAVKQDLKAFLRKLTGRRVEVRLSGGSV